MKKIYQLLLLVFIGCPLAVLAQSPSTGRNFVVETVVRTAGKKTAPALVGLSVDSANRNIQYLDGLGRPLQTVQWQGSPNRKDVVSHAIYDGLGRETKKYLPYAAQSSSDGSFKTDPLGSQAAFYGSSGWDANVVKTPYPYSVTLMEASPLNRPLEQGAPGAVWQPLNAGIAGSGHTVRPGYALNASGEVPLWTVGSSGAATSGSYANGKLSKTIVRDENWTSGKAGTTEEFRDMMGRVVTKRLWETESVSLSTHYLYDRYGNLSYVVPPAVTATSFSESSDANFNNYIYAYHYDGRKRLIEKKIPGKGWEYLVYNKLDQLVLSQDAVQRQANRWLFTKYDVLGRPVVTGLYSNSGSRATVQAMADAETVLWEKRDNANANGLGTGYTNLALPTSIDYYHSVSYYDDYDFYSNTFGQPNGTTQVSAERTRGLSTGSRITTLGTGNMLLTVNYYDEDGRIVTGKSQNHLSGTDVVNSTYDFTGQLMNSTRIHVVGSSTTTIYNAYSYDHTGRKTASRENINSQGEVTLSILEYNEIGQLKAKNLHRPGEGDGLPTGTDLELGSADALSASQVKKVVASNSITLLPGFEAASGSAFSASISQGTAQRTQYAYNERGWLKGTNSSEFSVRLGYDTLGNPQYNGNISAQLWGSGSSLPNRFNYSYDRLNRLTNGTTSAGLSMGEVVTYDVMGNITSLSRNSGTTGSYSYTGNQLTSITGGPLATGSYGYDANGNATTDGRTGVTLTYNYLNLPVTATKSGLNLSYVYDASGQKLRKINATTATTTDYVDGIQYANGMIDFIQTEEGRAVNQGGTYKYEYNLTDHLGNVRYSFDIYAGAVRKLQEDNYYAFGLRYNSTAGTNNYLYNGKELQDELGQYDYGARFYDPVVGRFIIVDPKSEEARIYSVYSYAINNPVRFIDIYGEGPGDRVKAARKMTGADYKQETGLYRTGSSSGPLQFKDCSEFVNRVLYADGITSRVLDQNTSAMKTFFKDKSKFIHSKDPQAGDIALWNGHVGIVGSVKNGKIKLIHARGRGKQSKESSVYLEPSAYRDSEFYGYYRPVKETADGKIDNENHQTENKNVEKSEAPQKSKSKNNTTIDFEDYLFWKYISEKTEEQINEHMKLRMEIKPKTSN